jgi:hypothetical protein
VGAFICAISSGSLGARLKIEMETDFNIDLSNPAEVAAKMPVLRRLYEDTLRERDALNVQIELLRRLVGDPAGVLRVGARDPGPSSRSSHTRTPSGPVPDGSHLSL